MSCILNSWRIQKPFPVTKPFSGTGVSNLEHLAFQGSGGQLSLDPTDLIAITDAGNTLFDKRESNSSVVS
ncbi:MAG: hypothetical protein ACI8UO_004403 [Verrucomicrobiales bacterium]|jgi:hypothetical protein